MPDIRLPDGSVRSYAAPLSGADIAADIGKRLAKDALAVRIDGALRDLGTLVEDDAVPPPISHRGPASSGQCAVRCDDDSHTTEGLHGTG